MIDTAKREQHAAIGFLHDVLTDKFDDIEQAKAEARRLTGGGTNLSYEDKKPVCGEETVNVRVAVSVSPNREWVACGGSSVSLEEILEYTEHGSQDVNDKIYWLAAPLRVPTETEVAAHVEEDR